MKLYLAGLYANGMHHKGQTLLRFNERERAARLENRYFLESYHYVGKGRYAERLREDGTRIFLDSGAFSAFTKGVQIDLPRYCDFVASNEDIIEVASVLDGIGDPEETWKNQQAMEQQGVKPLPCFHYGEPVEFLQHYIENYEYITLGGMVPISTPQLKLWLDSIWENYLTDDQGKPKLKVHGFGLTTISLMTAYPWYSVDSSSWVQFALNGWVYFPGFKAVQISSSSSSAKKENANYSNMCERDQAYIERLIEQAEFETERVQQSYYSRAAFNIWAYNRLNDIADSQESVYKLHQQELFG